MLLTNHNEQTLKRLNSLIPSCNQIEIVVGYFSPGGFELLKDSFSSCLKKGGKVRILAGKIFEEQSYDQCLNYIKKWDGHFKVYVSTLNKSLVHGKIYLLQQDGATDILIGSSNLTSNGLTVNHELNILESVGSEQKEEVHKIINLLNQNSESLETHLRGGEKMDNNYSLKLLSKDSVLKIYKDAEKVLGDITQETISTWEKQIEEDTKIFREVFTEDALFDSKDWEGELFKENLLMERVWAIRDLKNEQRKVLGSVNSDLLKEKMMDMIYAAETETDLDEIVNKGKIPYKISTSITTEILFKYNPQRFPAKNRKTEWALCFITDTVMNEKQMRELPYSKFVQYTDEVSVVLKGWLDNKGISVNDKNKYIVTHFFFFELTNHSDYAEVIKLYKEGENFRWRNR